eukprot:TRINITY_DN547_c1_g1_i1.p3 TRINITY_DN547_c1_g1~~TRINITY_DN547_c1_g1_i1.p3  ORF type:complete len:167 (-),score=17.42 TRINITY_DN547_c1_g1_i1:507-1007(-)
MLVQGGYVAQRPMGRICGFYGNIQSSKFRLQQQRPALKVRQRRTVIFAAEADTDKIEQQIDELNSEELELAIAGRDRPLIIDFYAPWCGPCLVVADELKKVAKKLGEGVRIVKVDADKEANLASELQIFGLPTLIFVGTDSSKPALRHEGLLMADDIIKVVQTELQ